MAERIFVISLGGSRIVPDEVDYRFLRDFKRFVLSQDDCKFIVVSGGGSTARKYINALKLLGKDIDCQSEVGIKITRFHAFFLMKIFGKDSNDKLPLNVSGVKNVLKKNKVVICGSLRNNKNQTTDSAAARIACELGCPLINLTNVKGLYTRDPKRFKNARLIERISWKNFNDIMSKIKYDAGQNFVLDQKSARLIMKKKIVTYIVGSLNDVKNIVRGLKINGTLIKDGE